ncbi:hypothetical protein MHM84_19055 [Halomonas sp. McH1-25]|uniref:DUF411 domain-containing protein n=1 Tax=unclassified Halomonas TaxID=2609666 RepID=UPI001EF73192|nr:MULTISPECIES: DUF411 domain-containing protein [unclassified Halomonas]MCG7601853.1 hypothetical protein [Halomonas sp. McH1-25]MCP1343532.1 hypothetical protein [Halomonas sp. FL8]MCP1361648.1 hypothetical protein [Halomonas sp. BBD45]MCP1363662.1 hypothetical protein [Halomonas sp. BBD48]
MKKRFTMLLISGFLLVGAANVQAVMPDSARLYKNPSCGCCDEYAKHLEARGVEVEIVESQDLSNVKLEAGVPYGYGSCHTVMLDDYVIEGHVPLAAIDKLLAERPDADGIGLAGMPQGSPGMPGPKQAPFEIISFEEQEAAPFMTL